MFVGGGSVLAVGFSELKNRRAITGESHYARRGLINLDLPAQDVLLANPEAFARQHALILGSSCGTGRFGVQAVGQPPLFGGRNDSLLNFDPSHLTE